MSGLALAPPPRVALKREDAAAALGMSLDSFERYVQPHVRIFRPEGSKVRVVAVTELQRFMDERADAALAETLR
jgi:hypothetical protein